jgi:hypothetical protein
MPEDGGVGLGGQLSAITVTFKIIERFGMPQHVYRRCIFGHGIEIKPNCIHNTFYSIDGSSDGTKSIFA